jgi:TetR/AcrR family transcriptional repressor of nem operon
MARASIKEQLLKAGGSVVWEKGYAAGVRDIVAAAGARPGSFTNHFASKDDFVAEVLDRYFAYVSGLVEEALRNDGRSASERLRAYLDLITEKLASADWARGCMIGNLSLETAAVNERFREKLQEIFALWAQPFAQCIASGQESGEFSKAFAAGDLADFLLSSWQGAMLRMKVERSERPLALFKQVIFATIFKGER